MRSYYESIDFEIFEKILLSNQSNQTKVINNNSIQKQQMTQVTHLMNVNLEVYKIFKMQSISIDRAVNTYARQYIF